MLSSVHVVHQDQVAISIIARIMDSVGIHCHAYASPGELLHAPALACPSCVLADMLLPEMSPLQFMHRLREDGLFHPILFMANRVELDSIIKLLQQGAQGFLRKPLNQMELLEGVQKALVLDQQLGPRLDRAWRARQRIADLAPREQQVLSLVCRGASAAEAAAHLGLSARTVENHRLRLLRKLGLERIAEAIRLCAELELLSIQGYFGLPPALAGRGFAKASRPAAG